MKNSPFIIYQTEDGKVKIETHFENETVWLNQAQIGELFQKSKATISEHIKNIFKDSELEEELVVRDFRTTTQHGAIEGKTQTKSVKHYNLDVVISVDYRVKSHSQGGQCFSAHHDSASMMSNKTCAPYLRSYFFVLLCLP